MGEDVANDGEYESNNQCVSDELEKETKLENLRKLLKGKFTGTRCWVLADSPPGREFAMVFPPIKELKYVRLLSFLPSNFMSLQVNITLCAVSCSMQVNVYCLPMYM